MLGIRKNTVDLEQSRIKIGILNEYGRLGNFSLNVPVQSCRITLIFKTACILADMQSQIFFSTL